METPERHARAKALFLEALDRPPEVRDAFVRERARGDEDLASDVGSLLAHHLDVPLMANDREVPGLEPPPERPSEALPHPSDKDPVGINGLVLDGRYRVEAFVDEGGFSYVYRAEHVLWRRPVALKFFKELDSSTRRELKEAFIQEGSLMNELSRRTPAIVQSYDVGTWKPPRGAALLFTVLEWLDGLTLARFLRDERSANGGWGWPLERVISILDPVAEALGVAHERGIAHRDVKPSNVFLANDGGKTTTKLIDFGVAKVAASKRGFDLTGTIPGGFTLAYAAPEQLQRSLGPTGPWTDVYALALLSVELMAGRHPTNPRYVDQVVLHACDPHTRPTPRFCGLKVSDDVEAVFVRALAVDPELRYRDARQFWSALSATLTDAGPVSGVAKPAPAHAHANHDKIAPAIAAPEPVAVAPRETNTEKAPRRVSRRAAVVLGVLVAVLPASVAWTVARRLPRADPASANARTGAVAALDVPLTTIDPERLQSFGPLPQATPTADNPITDAKTRLGRLLFWDPILSRNRDVACVTCHELAKYGVDGLRVAMGSAHQAGQRNTLSIFNAAEAFALMWDGSAQDIEHQATAPILSAREMAMTEDEVVRRLRASEGYVEAFRRAFPEEGEPIGLANVGRAIGAFERQLYTPSRWDAYLEGHTDALSPEERAGFNAFVDAGCVTCHFGQYVGLTMFQKVGLVQRWPNERDRGRYELTKRPSDWMVFRVPSLRNVVKTGPYFHDGSVDRLDEAVRLMGRHQLGRELSDAKVASIVRWLDALTGVLPAELVGKPVLPTR